MLWKIILTGFHVKMCGSIGLLAALFFQLLTVMDMLYVIWRMVNSLLVPVFPYCSDAIFGHTTRGDQWREGNYMVFFIMRLQNPIPFLFCCFEQFLSSNSNFLWLFYFFTSRIIPIFIFRVHLCLSHFPFHHCQLKFEIFLFTGFHRFRFLYSVGFPTGSNNAWKHAF